jgi:hypothetical protein
VRIIYGKSKIQNGWKTTGTFEKKSAAKDPKSIKQQKERKTIPVFLSLCVLTPYESYDKIYY